MPALDVRATRSGPVTLPIEYRDASVVSVVFRALPERVAAVLGDLRLEPRRLAGRTTVVLTLFQYRDTSIGPYNELAVTSYVRPLDDRRLRAGSFWVHVLPVTTETACAAGLDIWGYPKWVTPIDFTIDQHVVGGGLPGDVSIEVPRGRGPALTIAAPFSTFTVRDGMLIRTRVPSRSRLRLVRGRRTRVAVTGSGRVAALLDRLGCTTMTPTFGFWCEHFASQLPAGEPIGAAWRSPRADGPSTAPGNAS
jgi:hypothetical protein